MDYVWLTAKVLQGGGVALMAGCFLSFRPRPEARLFKRPWLLAYGIVVFAGGSLLEVVSLMMAREPPIIR